MFRVPGKNTTSGSGTQYEPINSIEHLPWERPVDLLPLPDFAPGEQKFAGVYAVKPFRPYIKVNAVTTSGFFTVDWGDGAIATYDSSVDPSPVHFYDTASLADMPESPGFKQVLVTITPASGGNLTQLYSSYNSLSECNIVDAKIQGQFIDYLNFQGSKWLKRIDFPGFNNVTSLYRALDGCSALHEVVSLYTGKVTSFERTFYSCRQLRIIPELNFSAATTAKMCFSNCPILTRLSNQNTIDAPFLTDISYMFDSCTSLVFVPDFLNAPITSAQSMLQMCVNLSAVPDSVFANCDLSGLTSCASMFNGCTSLEKAPFFDASNVTDFTTMFQDCSSLEKVSDYDFSSGQLFANTFNGCSCLFELPATIYAAFPNALQVYGMCFNCDVLDEVGDVNLLSATRVENMFGYCRALRKVKSFNAPLATNWSGVFISCYELQSYPVLGNAAHVTNMYYFFGSQFKISALPMMDTSNVTNVGRMFFGLTEVEEIPPYDFSKVTSANQMLFGVKVKTWGPFGIGCDIDFSNISPISSSESSGNYSQDYNDLHVQIFAGLKDLTGLSTKTITISNNANTYLTQETKDLAINKNWTIAV